LRQPLLPVNWSKSLLTDDRSAAASRIALGVLALVDCAQRAATLEEFYTDAGLVPRSSARVIWEHLFPNSLGTWSLHFLGGSLSWQFLLLVLEACAALAFTVGYRARLAAVALFALFLSHCQRNALVCDAQDWAMVAFLLCASFVPLDRKWSVRVRTSVPGRGAIAAVNEEIGSFAFTAQLIMLLFFAGAQKLLNSGAWRGGEAISIILKLDMGTTAIGRWIGALPDAALRGANYSVLAAELALPWLLVVPVGRLLRGAAIVLIGLHLLAFAVCLRVGLFPWVVLAALLYRVPGLFWDSLGVSRRTSFEDRCATRPFPILSIVPMVTFVHALLLNLSCIHGEFSGPTWLDAPTGTLLPRQGWRMYSTAERSWRSTWIVLAARPNDERTSSIRLPDEAPLTFGPEAATDNLYGQMRFRVFWSHARALSQHHPTIIERVLRRQCSDFQVRTIDMVFVQREAQGSLSQASLAQVSCGERVPMRRRRFVHSSV
jgi:hypothetical protein